MESHIYGCAYVPAIAFVAVLALPICSYLYAATVPVDLLGGFGDFEHASVTRILDATTYKARWESPEPSKQIGMGWTGEARNLLLTIPGRGFVCDIVSGCKNGSRGQSMTVSGIPKGQFVSLTTPFEVKPGKRNCLWPGDTAVFKLDYIRMVDFEGAPVTFKIRLKWDDPVGAHSIFTDTVLTPSTTPFSASVSAVVPMTDCVRAYVWIDVNGDIGNHRPGIIFDGAHLNIVRGGRTLTEEVPVSANRGIRTTRVHVNARQEDPAEVAANYVSVILGREDWYAYSARLRYYNPNIKVYFYQVGGTITDGRVIDAQGNQQDSVVSNCPIGMKWVLDNHEEWLYRDPFNPKDKYDMSRPPFVGDPNFPRTYYVRTSDHEYQSVWLEAVLTKLRNYNMDGIFIDTLEAVPSIGRGWRHTVFSTLRKSAASSCGI